MATPALGSRWLLRRELAGGGAVPDQTIEITAVTGTEFDAKYVSINDSQTVFHGQIPERQSQALNLRQDGSWSGYWAFHIGTAALGTNEYVGHWCDVADQAGSFRMTPLA
jgi:hypothetical protein